MRRKRDIRHEAQWREIISGHPCSGQAVRAYCKALHVTARLTLPVTKGEH
ncbi:MAG: hypothetical protein ACKOS8_01525 [Gemmataceae bacterium]